jgi:hypothetical protein
MKDMNNKLVTAVFNLVYMLESSAKASSCK